MKNTIVGACIFLLLSSCGKKPTANFTWSPQNPKAGQEVQFTNSSVDAKKYDWNLGNMKISSDVNPKNVYDKAGSYIIDLAARNGLKSDTKTVTITVSP
jgi:PKD repeat protein